MGWGTITILVLIIFITYFAFIYNRLVTLKNRCMIAWSEIDRQLKRRYSIIPEFMEMVKVYASPELKTFEKVHKAADEAMSLREALPESIINTAEKENILTAKLRLILNISENYPELNSDSSFLNMQKELLEFEDRLKASRRFYNANVSSLNSLVESFPSNLIALLLQYKEMDYYEINDVTRLDIAKVSLD